MHLQLPRPAPIFAKLVAMSLGGCAVGPTYVPPDLAAPPSLVAANAPAASTPLSRVDETSADLAAWWRSFKDPELDALVARALSDNLDRQTAASRVREANEAALAVRASLLPSLNGTAAYDHTRISNNAGLSQVSSLVGGGASAGGVATAALPGLEFDSYTLGLSASWNPDLFGGTRSALRAARAC